LLQAEALAALEGRVNEPFAWDHFESFVFSQDDRLGVGTPVGTAYRAAIRGDPRIDHRVYPNLRRGAKADRVAAERDQEMFAVDLFHKLLRHSQAHHRRETIAFARRSNALLERMALMVVWRNFVKKISERSSEPLTPAMRAGAADRRWSWGDVLARRRFFGRLRPPPGWSRIYRREWITPAVGRNTIHDLKHAF